MSAPTVIQADRLRPLADGYAILTPRRGEWVGLLRKGWVERIDQTTPRGGILPPLRITDAGREALALTEPGEGECSETTSAPTCRCHAASGGRLPSLRSIGWARPLPSPGWARPSCSSASRPAPTPSPVATAQWPLPTTDDVRDDLEEMWRQVEERSLARQPRGGYNAGHRCWSCRRFVSGPDATCGHCGQRHGGVNHNAYASR